MPINVDALPSLCLNLVHACVSENRPKEAYKCALTGLKYLQLSDNATYKKDIIEAALLEIFSHYDAEAVDPALAGASKKQP